MGSAETHLPGALDVLLRDLHLLWCEDYDPEWHLAGAEDPMSAAIKLADAVWAMGHDAARGSTAAAAALITLNAYVESQ